MEDEKCCDEQCCERDEPLTQAEADGRNMATQYDHGDLPTPSLGGVEGHTLTLNNSAGLSFHDASGEIGVNRGNNGANRIHDTVIKQMDYGYLVKAGCQTLCISDQDHLLKLFEAYVKNPSEVWDAHNQGKLDELLAKQVVEKYKENIKKTRPQRHFVVVGKSKKDVHNYMLCVLGGHFYKRNNNYIVETQEVDLIYHPVSDPKDLCSLTIDKVVETYASRDNKKFSEIIQMCNQQLKR